MVEITHKGNLELAGSKIDCYITNGGQRLLSSRRMQIALKITEEVYQTSTRTGGAKIHRFLSQKSIKPLLYLINDSALLQPINAKYGNVKITGYKAELLPEICRIMSKARRDNLLIGSRQKIVAEQCKIIISSFAKIGITALIDEATGYNKKKYEYRELFKNYILEEAREWQKEFPDELMDIFYKVYGKQKIPKKNHPIFFGKLINKYIYSPLANSNGAILAHLRGKNPVIISKKGTRYRKDRFFQYLKEELGIPELRKHIWKFVGIGHISNSPLELERNFKKLFPKKDIQEQLFNTDEQEKESIELENKRRYLTTKQKNKSEKVIGKEKIKDIHKALDKFHKNADVYKK
jgi:hypothetical protein